MDEREAPADAGLLLECRSELSRALRQGRRLEWIEQALEPLRGRLDKNDFERLVNGLAMTVGVEAYIALRDVCGLDNQAAIATMRWAGHALITAA